MLAAQCWFVIFLNAQKALPQVLATPLRDDLGIPFRVTLPTAGMAMLIGGLVTPFGPFLTRAVGVKITMVLCALNIACTVVLTTMATEDWHIIFLWSQCGIAQGVGSSAPRESIAASFETGLFTANAMVLASEATGVLIFLPPLVYITDTLGWRMAMYYLGVFGITSTLVLAAFIFDHPSQIGIRPYGAKDEFVQLQQPPKREKVSLSFICEYLNDSLIIPAAHSSYWVLIITFSACGFASYGIFQVHFIPLAEELGMPRLTAAGLIATLGVADVFGTLASGLITDKLAERHVKYLLAVVYLVRGAFLLLLPSTIGPELYWFTVMLIIGIGLDYVASAPPTFALTYQVFGKERGPAATSWFSAGHAFGAAASATAGTFAEASDAYVPYLVGVGVIIIAAAVLALSMKTTRISFSLDIV